MFENQTNLQEKWGRLLDFDGLDPIRDSHRRNVTAQLLENQEKYDVLEGMVEETWKWFQENQDEYLSKQSYFK